MTDLYEQLKLYKLNPCDRDAFSVLGRLGRAAAKFSTHCPCCSGSRTIAAAIAGAMYPTATVTLVVAAFMAALIATRHETVHE